MNKTAAAVSSILCSAMSVVFLFGIAFIHDYKRHVEHADVAMFMLGIGCFGAIVVALIILMVSSND